MENDNHINPETLGSIDQQQAKPTNLDEMLRLINQQQDEISKLKESIPRLFRSKNEKKQLNTAETLLESNINHLEKRSTFDFDVATQFITDVLSITEGEEYQKTDLELVGGLNLSYFIVLKIPIFDPDEDICLITTKNNTQLISEMDNNDELEDSDDIQETLENIDGKYILLGQDNTYTMFDVSEQSIPNELTYPYLSNIITDLINLRLAKPNLSDEQATQEILQQIPQKYPDLIKN